MVCSSNLNVGGRASRNGRVDEAEEVVHLAARAGRRVGAEQDSHERRLGDGQLRRRHGDERRAEAPRDDRECVQRAVCGGDPVIPVSRLEPQAGVCVRLGAWA